MCYYIDAFIEINSDLINREYLRGYLVSYFEKYTSKLQKTDENFWTLLYLCKIGNHIKSGDNTWIKQNVYLEDAITVFKNYMIKNLDYFLVIFVSNQPFYGDRTQDFKTGVDENAKSIFGSFEKFLDFLKSDELKSNLASPSEFLGEFKIFTEEFIKNNGNMIPFKFTYTPVLEKLDAVIKSQNY